MKMSELFIGRPVYWGLAAAIVAVLAFLGLRQEHVKDFVPFQFAVLALALVAVGAVMVLYRPGEKATREPLDFDDAA
ncbi:MAG: hypothetical protein CMM77_11985 [Rhodospirillaceae bacterium]|nr:hypothetical protein [Magnetovibrio sp.]MAY67836.1 hypothetical protein [Rhodospirillaceae bacterium]